MKKNLIVAGAVVVSYLCAYIGAYADCESECAPAQSCATLLECKMAEIDCQQSCRQRHVLEGLAEALEKITTSMRSASVGQLDETQILTQPEAAPTTEESPFPALGEHRKQKTTPFIQIDRGTTVIISDEEE